ncbi:hypothetical protein GCM10009737_22020 [Nocardioides lentus]|uniref:Glycosyltransferase 2-like domain-containing protein n=1 Tax=Nocardioides lentus TaxID=338077 RepID=A0ABN2PIB4_9ACTN
MGDTPRSRAPFVSFLTTAYRTEDYVAATIASVRAQLDGDWELVVVDNGPSDAMAAIVTRVADEDPRVRLVRQDNAGYVGGLEAAAAVATGEFVVPLDSDDQLEPEFVSSMRAFLRDHPGADVVGCDAHLFSDGRDRPHGRGYMRSVGMRLPAGDGERLGLADLLDGRIPYYGALVRRSAWRAVGGYGSTEPDVDESVDVWLRLVADHEVWVSPRRLARYRVRDDSLSRHPSSVAAFEHALVNSFLAHARRHPDDARVAALVDRTVRRLRYHQALRRARYHFARGEVADARREVRDAARQRRTPRVLLVLVALHVAPGLLAAVHPLKARLERWISHRLPQDTGEQRRRPALRRERSAPAPRRTRSAAQPRGQPPTSP